jgi:hypothetical protein
MGDPGPDVGGSVQYSFTWKQWSVIAAVGFWHFYFCLFPGAIRAPQCVEFLKVLKRHIVKKLLIIGDGLKVHKSRLARISHRYVGRRVECVPLSTAMGNTSELLRLKREPGCQLRKSALVSTNMCLPLDKICVRRQGHPRALLQTQINNDVGR